MNEPACASGTVTPEQAKLLKPGQSVQIQRERRQERHRASVTLMHDQLQKATGMVEVLVEIPTQPATLGVGRVLSGERSARFRRKRRHHSARAFLQCSDGYFGLHRERRALVRTPVKVGVVNARLRRNHRRPLRRRPGGVAAGDVALDDGTRGGQRRAGVLRCAAKGK